MEKTENDRHDRSAGTTDSGTINSSTINSDTRLSLIWNLLKGSRLFFVISIFATLMVNVFDMISPQIIRTTIDCVIGDKELELPGIVSELAGRYGSTGFLRSHLWAAGGAIVLLAACSAVFRYVSMVFNSRGAEHFAKTMRDCLFSHIQKLPFSWHMKNQTGDIIQRCTSDVDTIKNFISEQLTAVFRIIMMIVLSLFFMFSMNVKLTMVALVFIPIIFLYSRIFA